MPGIEHRNGFCKFIVDEHAQKIVGRTDEWDDIFNTVRQANSAHSAKVLTETPYGEEGIGGTVRVTDVGKRKGITIEEVASALKVVGGLQRE